MRLVDKYQYNLQDITKDGQISNIIAKHVVLNQYFTLKRLNIKGQNHHSIYQVLLAQVSLLKQLNHDYIVKCQKMLKTSNSIYLVYDCIGKNTLARQLLENKQISNSQKINIAAKIADILVYLNKKNVYYLNLNPQCIQMIDNNELRIFDFRYSICSNKKLIQNADYSLLDPNYTAPEVLKNEGTFASDVYSLGKLMKTLRIEDKRINNLDEIIQDMCNKQSKNRPNINQIAQLLFSINSNKTVEITSSYSNGKVKNKATNNNNNNNNKSVRLKTNEDIQNNSEVIRTSLHKIDYNNNADIIKSCVLKVIKQRNLALFLLQLAKNILQLSLQSTLSTIISFLMLKKSTLIISNMTRYFCDRKFKFNNNYLDNQRTIFCKSQEFKNFKLFIDRQMYLHHKWMLKVSDCVQQSHCDKFDKNQKFVIEIKSSKFNQQYLKCCIIEFLQQLIKNNILQYLQQQQLIKLSLMSLINDFQTYQKLFDQLVDQNQPILNNQSLITKTGRLSKDKIISCIQEIPFGKN